MNVGEPYSHRLGSLLLEDEEAYAELCSLLATIRIPICPGFKRPPFDVKQGLLNRLIDRSFEEHGWETQPLVDRNNLSGSQQKGDFTKATSSGLRILVEVEFGNVASTFRDLYKFNLAYALDSYDVGVLVVPDDELASRIDTVQNFDGARRLVHEARQAMNLPLVILPVGLDGREVQLLDLEPHKEVWKSYKISDFDDWIESYPELTAQ
jgi:hypothetical protein